MLTDVQVRKLEVKEKRYMLSDGNGLYIEVLPTGKKCWRVRIKIEGKEHRRSLGQYSSVSLKDARKMRDTIKMKLAVGENPFLRETGNTFEAVAKEWLEKKVYPVRKPAHIRTVTSRLKRFVFPFIGDKHISEIKGSDVLAFLRAIEARGTIETAHRVLQICSQIFRYGIAIDKTDRDVTADLKGALIPVYHKSYPTLTDPEKIGALMRAIDGINGSLMIRCALLLQAYTFVRPGELRKGEWSEIDLFKQEWRIPPEKMKMKRLHVVPLSRQSIEILKELNKLTGESKYLFPSPRSSKKPMSDATVNAALRRLGYGQKEFTGHGFRSMASTILNEKGWSADVIERQLAHVEKNSVRAAYNHAEYLDKRQEMMQWWADWLEEQKGSI